MRDNSRATPTRAATPTATADDGHIAAVLRAFATLTGSGDRLSYDVMSGGRPLVWLGLDSALTEQWQQSNPMVDSGQTAQGSVGSKARLRASPALERMASLDALHEHERLLREGWVYVVGTAAVDEERRRVCLPLLSRPVRLSKTLGSFVVVGTGDVELTALVTDPAKAAELERDAQFGGGALTRQERTNPRLLERLPRLTAWARAVAGAAGLAVAEVLPWTHAPATLRDRDDLVAVVGGGLHLARDVSRPGLGGVLRDWSRVPQLTATAFGRLYARAAAPPVVDDPDEVVSSPLPLTAVQRAVVRRARHEPVVAVSGAPGNGKSHTVAAIAIDAVALGRSVLVATPSRYAADVISDLLRRRPGPDPVVFGSTARRRALAAELSDGVVAVGRRQLHDAGERHERATRRVGESRAAIVDLLEQEATAQRLSTVEPLIPVLHRFAPGLFDVDADLELVSRLLRTVDRDARHLFDRARQRLAWRRLSVAAECVDSDRAQLRRALDAARSVRAAATLAADGGTRIGALWDELFAAERVAAEGLGEVLSLRAALARSTQRARVRAVAALASALRSGRATRRERLRDIDASALVSALPLWVGALTDIDDLLPPVPGMFDLLILDEASQIDQPRAAPALLRARRAVVVGDPRQLRHVSFVADAEQRRALDEAGVATAAAQLDVRRMSAFDATAAVTPVTFLDEHHRGVPHLIAFSARRFYGDRVRLRTRHPANESLDAIRVETVAGVTNREGVVEGEIARVADVLDGLAGDGVRSIGVVSPFRAQTDALEQMVLDRFTLDDIERLGLRVGTAHAFQGAERDVIVVSLGLTDADAAQRRRFVEDPTLFNVLITRARQRLVVVTAVTDPGDGLLSDYLAYARRPPQPQEGQQRLQGWPATLATELRRQGATVRPAYRVGAQVIDLVVGDGTDARAVECRLHPDGVDAHIARRRLLHDTGWAVVEAWPSRHDHDPIGAALDVLTADD